MDTLAGNYRDVYSSLIRREMLETGHHLQDGISSFGRALGLRDSGATL